MGPEIVYVSGRKRGNNEMNGKSANLNNCLRQIYPAGIRIPPHELVCIFDADQVFTQCYPRFSSIPVECVVHWRWTNVCMPMLGRWC